MNNQLIQTNLKNFISLVELKIIKSTKTMIHIKKAHSILECMEGMLWYKTFVK